MNLLADYVQPLTHWLQENPNWSLFITFLVSMTESMAIIGSIIPGSVTMTAIGILAGSGIMRIDFTLLAAILGAICGDGVSYFIGYWYSDKLVEIWPFNRYPALFDYGKKFFHRHGGKSILFGRFVGPLRSIIPVVAGIMHMKKGRFLLVNALSAVLWSFTYVMPGVLIGAASHELSAETAARLIMFILLTLLAIWIVTLFIKWLLQKLHFFLMQNLHEAWLSLKDHPILYPIIHYLTPPGEKQHYQTAVFLVGTLVSFILFLVFMVMSLAVHWYPQYNMPFYLLIQSFRTKSLDLIFITFTQFTSLFTLVSVFLASLFCFLFSKNYRTIKYVVSILLTSFVFGLIFAYICHTSRPQGLLVTLPGSSFPALYLQIATAFYGFLLFYMKTYYDLLTNTLRTSLLVVLGLSGLGYVYLGDYWLTDVLAAYCAGVTVCLLHCLMYRKSDPCPNKVAQSILMVFTLLSILIVVTISSTYVNYKMLVHNHSAYQKKYTLNEKQWWDQQNTILPLYVLNRIGTPISLLNIQYYGELDVLEEALEEQGWEAHTESFFAKLLQRMNADSEQIKLPLLDVLFNNKHPELVMTFTQPESNMTLELRIWESNYNIDGKMNPIYIGSVHHNRHTNTTQIDSTTNVPKLIDPLTFMLPSLKKFSVRRISLTDAMIKPTMIPTTPYVILIKQEEP